jgi:hypothetical protein
MPLYFPPSTGTGLDAEGVRDTIAAALVSGTNVTIVVDDAADTITISATRVAVNTRTASYTLALTDPGKVVEMNVATSNTLTVPPNSSVPIPVDSVVGVDQIGAGLTVIAAGAGVTCSTLPVSGRR